MKDGGGSTGRAPGEHERGPGDPPDEHEAARDAAGADGPARIGRVVHSSVSDVYTEAAREAMAIARQSAQRQGRREVEPWDLLMALLWQADPKVVRVVTTLLEDVGADPAGLEGWVRRARSRPKEEP